MQNKLIKLSGTEQFDFSFGCCSQLNRIGVQPDLSLTVGSNFEFTFNQDHSVSFKPTRSLHYSRLAADQIAEHFQGLANINYSHFSIVESIIGDLQIHHP